MLACSRDETAGSLLLAGADEVGGGKQRKSLTTWHELVSIWGRKCELDAVTLLCKADAIAALLAAKADATKSNKDPVFSCL